MASGTGDASVDFEKNRKLARLIAIHRNAPPGRYFFNLPVTGFLSGHDDSKAHQDTPFNPHGNSL